MQLGDRLDHLPVEFLAPGLEGSDDHLRIVSLHLEVVVFQCRVQYLEGLINLLLSRFLVGQRVAEEAIENLTNLFETGNVSEQVIDHLREFVDQSDDLGPQPLS